LGAKKGSGAPNTEKIGNLSMKQLVRIAKVKREELLAKDLKAAAKEISGSCISMGVTINEKDPRIVQQEIDEKDYDELLKEE